ncbi:SLC2A4 regulator isoform 3-T3 [Megaptera novaeangliae]
MEAERPPAPGPGCGRPPLRAAGRDPAAAPVSVPAPPQGPAVEFALPQEPEPRAADLGAPGAGAAGPPTPSAHIPVPGHRAPPGKARLDEVMAAAALTSLSTSPLLLGAPAVAFSTEPSLEPWREAPVRPPGSGGSSRDGGWGPTSDQSSPSTPSPPLPPEAAHFLFGEPALRKRKQAAGRAGAERWRGGLLLHGAGCRCGLADRWAVWPDPGVPHGLRATRLPPPGAAGAPGPAQPAAPARPAPAPGAELPARPPGLPGTRPPGATAHPGQGLRASPARQARCQPEEAPR